MMGWWDDGMDRWTVSCLWNSSIQGTQMDLWTFESIEWWDLNLGLLDPGWFLEKSNNLQKVMPLRWFKSADWFLDKKKWQEYIWCRLKLCFLNFAKKTQSAIIRTGREWQKCSLFSFGAGVLFL
jgi:hypothetical protein